MYGDAIKVVGADFEVAELTSLIERAITQAAVANGSTTRMEPV